MTWTFGCPRMRITSGRCAGRRIEFCSFRSGKAGAAFLGPRRWERSVRESRAWGASVDPLSFSPGSAMSERDVTRRSTVPPHPRVDDAVLRHGDVHGVVVALVDVSVRHLRPCLLRAIALARAARQMDGLAPQRPAHGQPRGADRL